MKILVVCQFYYPEPFRVTDICEELVKRGHSVTVLTGLPNYPEGTILKEYKKKEHRDEYRNGVRIIRCYEHGRKHSAIHLFLNYMSFAFSSRMKVRKLDKDFDVVFIYQLSPVMMSWAGIKYAKKHKVKSVLYCLDLWPASLMAGGIKRDSFIYNVFKKISKKIYTNVDKIAVTSKSFIKYFKDEHKIDSDKITYLPQYCEDIFNHIEEPKIDKDTFDLVFAGNIGKMQSVETIIKAANLLKDNEKIKFHIVGDGSDLENCKKLAKEYELNNVIFYGRRPIEEMPKFYSLADAMLVTLAKNELISYTLPGKVQSYMAAGKPIIGAVDGETKMIVEEAECGLICESENYQELSKIILELNTLDKKIMSNNALNNSNEKFKKDIFINQLMILFK